MHYRQEYKKLLLELERLGGSIASLQGVGSFYSLSNEVKVKMEIQRLKNSTLTKSQSVEKIEKEPKKIERDSKNGLISDYPLALHSVYLYRQQLWLNVCSLKIKLNKLPPESEQEALRLQWDIQSSFEYLDQYDNILKHWRENKKILSFEKTSESFKEEIKNLNSNQLIQKLFTMRSNISNREKTLKKLKERAQSEQETPLSLKSKIIKKEDELNIMKMKVKILEEILRIE